MGFIGRLTLIALVVPTYLLADSPTTIKNIRLWAEDERTRVVLDVSSAARHSMFTLQGPDRLVVDVVSGEIVVDAMAQACGFNTQSSFCGFDQYRHDLVGDRLITEHAAAEVFLAIGSAIRPRAA